MLSRMKVGTKLGAVVLPPLIALLAFVGLGVVDRLDEAEEAARDAELLLTTAELGDLTAALQVEASRSMTRTGSVAGVPAGELAEARAATDQQVAVLGERVAAGAFSGSSVVEDGLGAVQRRLGDLAGLREAVDRGSASAGQLREGYGAIVRAASRVSREIPAETAIPALTQELLAVNTLGSASESFADQAAVVAGLLGRSTDPALSLQEAKDLAAETRRREETFQETAGPALAAAFDEQLPYRTAEELAEGLSATDEELRSYYVLQSVPAVASLDDVLFSLDDWLAASEDRIADYRAVERAGAGGLVGVAQAAADEADRATFAYLVVAGVALVVALVSAFAVSRAITRPLRRLTTAADDLATRRLPALVESMRTPEPGDPEEVQPIQLASHDELGSLAAAFNAVQATTLSVAQEQAELLRSGIGDIFVNLARRNQSLLDRQIEFIDELEAHEEDPEQLEQLFRLDHLATRMRRNAESLLVLAGAEPTRRRGRPVPLSDVVRVAIGEVEDFTRVSILALDEVEVLGAAAADLAHLLSELMENATQFSPPETRVELLGHRSQDGRYVLSVGDHGVGMNEHQLHEANHLLAHPPLVGLSIGRSLGFIVVGRLAKRFGIRVALTPSHSGGVTAVVTLPAELVVEHAEEPAVPPAVVARLDQPAPAPPPAPVPTPPAAAAPTPPPPPVEPEPVAWRVQLLDEGEAPTPPEEAAVPPAEAPTPVAEAPAPATRDDEVQHLWSAHPAGRAPTPPVPVPDDRPASLGDALPEGDRFEAGLAGLVGGQPGPEAHLRAPLPPVEQVPLPPAWPAGSAAAPPPLPTRHPHRTTDAGLERRSPGATLDQPHDADAGATASRSPEEVRQMLSRYRGGLRRGRLGDGEPGGDPR